MLDNNKINYYSNKFKISIDTLLEDYKDDKKTLYKIFKKIYHLQTGLIIYRPKLQYLLLFTPLPKYFKTKDFGDLYLNICGKYSYHGDPSSNILMGNVMLPHQDLSPIPFFFQYKYNFKNKYLTSNIFYFEIKVDTHSFRSPWSTQSIAIGVGSIDTPIKNNHVGWTRHTVGYHSDDGNVFSDNQILCNLPAYSYGDVIGCAIEYCDEFSYKIYFTKNGKLLPFAKLLYTNKYLTPMISLDHSASIETNFGERNFKFDVEYLKSPFVISTYNYFIHNYFKLSKYTFESNSNYFNLSQKKLMIKKKVPFNNYNTIQNIMFNNELLEPLIKNDQNELTNFLSNEDDKTNFQEMYNISNTIIENLKKDIEFLSNINV